MAEETQVMYTLKEIASILVKDRGISEGFYETVIEFSLGVGNIGLTPETASPGAMLNVTKIGISKTPTLGISSIDAAIVNPPK